MRRVGSTFAVALPVLSLILLHLIVRRAVAAVPVPQQTQSAKLVSGPELELANETTAIIRWTATNPGGTALWSRALRHRRQKSNGNSEVAQPPKSLPFRDHLPRPNCRARPPHHLLLSG
jgi:hypothetical protein